MNLNNKNHPVYEPEKWNKDIYIKKTHNCYAYALNLIHTEQANICKKYMKLTKKHDCPILRPQPGQYSGYIDEYKPSLFTTSSTKCSRGMEIRIKKDNPLIRKLRKNQECPDNFYKIALFIASDGSDYHFYRQDNNGLWSHKDGWKLATNKDAKGRIIKNPETADRGNLDLFCGYYAVPNLSKYKNMSNMTRPYKNKVSETQKILNMIKKNELHKAKKGVSTLVRKPKIYKN